MLNELLVIEGDTQFFGNHPAHRQTAGAVLSADGDDTFFHNIASLLSGTDIIVTFTENVN